MMPWRAGKPGDYPVNPFLHEMDQAPNRTEHLDSSRRGSRAAKRVVSAVGGGVLFLSLVTWQLASGAGLLGGIVIAVDLETRERICKEMSPIYHVTKDDAPTLILHGDADALVPLQQSEIIVEKLKEAGVPAELIVKKGAAHGIWPSMLTTDFATIANWFDKYLQPHSTAQAAN